jgi:Tol biopolymer transport system component
MNVTPGARFGSFEILAPLGTGGMGEVYRARDTRLHRDVALKLLPKDFAHDAERVARFTREARLLASLSHPNIAAIYGIEEHEGEIALVLELVEGPTLADQLASGALSLASTLSLAQQVAEAIEAAHARGVIHRDLKPSNLKITPDGKVKVLDFGIAKALADDSAPGSPGSESALTTRSGVVIGTPGYMSPEQTAGGTVDRRTDVWAFGCVLFEALAGRRAFDGMTISDTLVRVLEREPDWDALPRSTPEVLEQLLARCLRKDARQRLQDIGDARIEIEDLRTARTGLAGRPTRSARAPRPQSVLRWSLAALAVLALVALSAWRLLRGVVAPSAPVHFSIALPPGVILPMNTEHPVLALSPDGTQLVFVGEEQGTRRLYSRRLGDPAVQAIPGTEGAADPFFSPDGAWITYLSGLMIKKVAATGGAPVAIHASTPATVNHGAAWAANDQLIYAASANSGLAVGSAIGGRAQGFADWAYITSDSNGAYAWPSALPVGGRILFTDIVGDTPDDSHVNALSLGDKRIIPLINGGTSGRYSATGHLLFARAGALYAVAFDVKRARIAGPESRVLDSVVVEPNGAAQYAVSAGTLAFVSGPAVTRERELVWVDRAGKAVTLRDDGREYSFPRLSPEGNRLGVTTIIGSNSDVWVLDLRTGAAQRVTTTPGEDFEPVWHPDGTRMAMSAEQQNDEGPGLAWTNLAELRLEFPLRTPGSGNWEFPTSWSPDGKWVAFTRNRAGAASDIEMFPTSGARTPVPFASSPASEAAAMFSPKSPVVAFVSDVSGRDEVYVRAFPGSGEPPPISTNGGIEPVWSRDGRELFYREGNAIKSVKVGANGEVERGAPRTVFEGEFEFAPYGGRSANYDVALDGQRFLMVRRKNQPTLTTIHVVLNWPEALLNRHARREQ